MEILREALKIIAFALSIIIITKIFSVVYEYTIESSFRMFVSKINSISSAGVGIDTAKVLMGDDIAIFQVFISPEYSDDVRKLADTLWYACSISRKRIICEMAAHLRNIREEEVYLCMIYKGGKEIAKDITTVGGIISLPDENKRKSTLTILEKATAYSDYLICYTIYEPIKDSDGRDIELLYFPYQGKMIFEKIYKRAFGGIHTEVFYVYKIDGGVRVVNILSSR